MSDAHPQHFADRLTAKMKELRNQVCVGLDPRYASLPSVFQSAEDKSDPSVQADAYAKFCKAIIDVVRDRVPVVKPQLAFFEVLGVPGLQALAEVIDHAHDAGLLVLLDGKRNDIGSTAEAYAQAYLGPKSHSIWGGDALTVSPYLGDDSLKPFVERSVETGSGIFVLVKTSNPGSGQLQDLVCDGQTIYQKVASWLAEINSKHQGESGYGIAGAVAGATHPEQLAKIRSENPHTILLVPGYGAQGGGAADVAAAFDSQGLGAIVNSSRGIIFAHQAPTYREKFGEARWEEAVSAATDEMIEALRSVSHINHA